MSNIGDLQNRAATQAKADAYDNALAAQARQASDLAALDAGYKQGAIEGMAAMGVTPNMLMAANTAKQYEQAGMRQRGIDDMQAPNAAIPGNATQGTRMSQLDDPRGNTVSPEAAAYMAQVRANKAGSGLGMQGIGQ